ncbi:MAG: SpoIIE family protein phosphatase, partial [Thermoanaerobaculia bacterium]
GAPLGSPLDFPYRKKELELSPGDTVLLMSDGFPESGSESHDPLGYEGAEHAFRRAAASGADPKAVIDDLLETVSSRSRGHLEDDVTLFVLRATS